jgi:hypothetical protein
MHSSPENEDLLYAYLAELSESEPDVAFERTFGRVDLYALDASFREHVRELAK